PIPESPNPSQVAGAPVANGTSGLRPGAPGPTRPIQDGDGGEIDNLAAMAVSDIEQFWAGAYGAPLTGNFAPVNAVFSWDSRYKNGSFCGAPTYDTVNAMWCGSTDPRDQNCPDDRPSPPATCTLSRNTIGWDRGQLMPEQRDVGGDMGVAVVLAHEYGHAIQHMAALVDITNTASATVAEQQADCFAGVYMRWVADGKSPRFTLSTGDGLAKLLRVMIGIRDPLLAAGNPAERRLVHGSAFERVTAFQFGFDGGVRACAGINEAEIAQRRTNLPKELLEHGTTGETPITNESAKSVLEALNKLFPLSTPPQLVFEQPPCPDAHPSPPAWFCPSSNTISVDMPRLVMMGTSLARGSPLDMMGPLFGDYTAFSVLVSRFMMALEKQHGGLALDNTNAGLRTACLTGVATAKLSKPVVVSNGVTIALSGGDLDEAVSGLLTNGAAAGDVNGASAPSVFARIAAFRVGVLGDQDRCYKRWP
ncbi:neutral zinc metallopeptidase, partial [Mycobacterium sp. E787]|uniref:neutral zinc metallopeptidase n=2 Tax=unclassified Mycobacterium TaxID=2642494 RepID=UPI000ABA87C8